MSTLLLTSCQTMPEPIITKQGGQSSYQTTAAATALSTTTLGNTGLSETTVGTGTAIQTELIPVGAKTNTEGLFDWRNATVYFAMTDRFFNGDPFTARHIQWRRF